MSGVVELEKLLASMNPSLQDSQYVFCTVSGKLVEFIELEPLATFMEAEGLTLVLEKSIAERAGLVFDGVFSQITLTVHSSLEAVGLTAAVSDKLTEKSISANVIAAYYHDHVFVPWDKRQEALSALQEFNY
ncbi:ACT domain-containing protein [Marinomonas pollencensis]|uniref:Uncharacterized protein n=1 Tax=Marinomonas pollencensis TaxID=491954 RepID=A0A3E0DT51_9GAMM|nr:ACT domain-containing protein [Marinomonas pollencensis]REG85141.1 hypothetical protein DFP81_103341 [Marinomonas pollencensis]